MENEKQNKKLKILCLHGFRTSGAILQKEVEKWPQPLLQKLDLVFMDGPYPAQGKSGVDGIFEPPFYEWFQADEGAMLAATIPGMQREGVALTKVPKVKFLIIASGAKFGSSKFGIPKLASASFSTPITTPSLHIIGETDIVKEEGIGLLESFVDPLIIHHPNGHTIPMLDDKSLEIFYNFIAKIQDLP
ncbi:esterase AGAP003155 isoform X2 [Helianthus annuus]|uniref:esterase AGAP003155 isoform X2 n=1 Tax=Helianthus annuus TaxID=4232 RepID=UPI000B8FCEDB|nr:esterase AGAP003155 isoform X2 [Helianthus annuus]